MRVLLLGNSNDSGEWFDEGPRRHELVQSLLAEASGEPVEVIPKTIWPNEGLERVIEGWIERYQPDVVYLTMAAYWFCYLSVPLRVKRLLRRFGPSVANAGARLAESPRWAYNPVFRATRGALQRSIGGDSPFTTTEVIDRMTAVITTIMRGEGIVMAIQGPDGRTNYAHSRRGEQRNEQRRQVVDRAMRELCASRHVSYRNSETPVWTSDQTLRKNRVGDGLHANARWHEYSAELIFETIAAALDSAGRPLRGPVTGGVPQN